MSVDLNSNFFELFATPVSFDIDLDELAQRYRLLQSEYHPDRFATADAASRRAAMQMATHINEAYQTLKSPLQRGRYLLKLQQVEVDLDGDTASDGAFLMQQMEFRERMEEMADRPDPLNEVDALRADINKEHDALIDAFRNEYQQGDLAAAKQTWLKLQFYERLLQQLNGLEAQLEDTLMS